MGWEKIRQVMMKEVPLESSLDIEKATRCVEPWVLHATEELLNTAPETKDAPYVG